MVFEVTPVAAIDEESLTFFQHFSLQGSKLIVFLDEKDRSICITLNVKLHKICNSNYEE